MIREKDEADPAEDALLNHEAINDPLGYAAQVVIDVVDREKCGVLKMTEEGQYVLKEESCWITVGNLSVYVKREEEAARIDVYPLNDEMSKAIASTYAFFEDAETEEEEA